MAQDEVGKKGKKWVAMSVKRLVQQRVVLSEIDLGKMTVARLEIEVAAWMENSSVLEMVAWRVSKMVALWVYSKDKIEVAMKAVWLVNDVVDW